MNSLIILKQKGGNKSGLSYPSDDVLSHFINNSRIFESIKYHNNENNSPLSDHVVLLIKSITLT
ncbi:THAP-type domain-containing protein [Aphis craccivora]|uniref:THAP-type domain-containing protein n=1 Tax=Aphis craccivora TaxID=307492 RepID=A0A6G0ZQ82_APHCR|nr:THAP-type domain-containing protein [Aphis craccivora]